MKWRTIRASTTLEKIFEEMRNNKEFHTGLGELRLSLEAQKEICKVVKRNQFTFSTKCEQMLSFVMWYASTKDKSLLGKEEEIIHEWNESK